MINWTYLGQILFIWEHFWAWLSSIALPARVRESYKRFEYLLYFYIPHSLIQSLHSFVTLLTGVQVYCTLSCRSCERYLLPTNKPRFNCPGFCSPWVSQGTCERSVGHTSSLYSRSDHSSPERISKKARVCRGRETRWRLLPLPRRIRTGSESGYPPCFPFRSGLCCTYAIFIQNSRHLHGYGFDDVDHRLRLTMPRLRTDISRYSKTWVHLYRLPIIWVFTRSVATIPWPAHPSAIKPIAQLSTSTLSEIPPSTPVHRIVPIRQVRLITSALCGEFLCLPMKLLTQGNTKTPFTSSSLARTVIIRNPHPLPSVVTLVLRNLAARSMLPLPVAIWGINTFLLVRVRATIHRRARMLVMLKHSMIVDIQQLTAVSCCASSSILSFLPRTLYRKVSTVRCTMRPRIPLMVQTMANTAGLIVIPCRKLIATARRKFPCHAIPR